MSIKKIASGSILGIFAKIVDAIAKFVTIPLLIGFYGKADYGLVALAFSLNAYLRLMDMGFNTGSIRFFSIWFGDNETEKIYKVSQSSIVFYGIIGIINAIIFIVLGIFVENFFTLLPNQIDILRWMLYILAISSIFNWTSYVVTQLLTSCGELPWINAMVLITGVLNFVIAVIAVKLKLPLSLYFLLYILSTLIIIPFNIFRLYKTRIARSSLLFPKWNYEFFQPILKYSLGIFAMGIFQFSADNLRPLILVSRSGMGVQILTDYRVIQTISMLVIAFGGIFTQVLLPYASKSLAQNDKKTVERIMYDGTKYISLFLSFIVFLLILNAKAILLLFVGPTFIGLYPWLVVWLFTLLYMHNAPISSLVLSTGKTKMLVYCSAFSSIVSLVLTAILAPSLGVGAAVLGYLTFIIIQISFDYLYNIPHILKLSSSRLFWRSFTPPTFFGILSCLIGLFIIHSFHLTGFIGIIASSIVFTLIYLALCLSFFIKKEEIFSLKKKLLS